MFDGSGDQGPALLVNSGDGQQVDGCDGDSDDDQDGGTGDTVMMTRSRRG